MKLAENEETLYHAVAELQRLSNALLGKVNDRNHARMEEEKRIAKASTARKRSVGYIIFAGAAAAMFLFYKGMGLF